MGAVSALPPDQLQRCRHGAAHRKVTTSLHPPLKPRSVQPCSPVRVGTKAHPASGGPLNSSDALPHASSLAERADEINFHEEKRHRIIRSIDREELEAHPGLGAIITEFGRPISPPKDADYALPAHFAQTVASAARAELPDLLRQLRELRSEMVGLTLAQAEILYNGDEYTLLLRDEFDAWLNRQLHVRLATRSFRDRRDPWSRTCRVLQDLQVWAEALILAPGSGHVVVLQPLHRTLAWTLCQEPLRAHIVRDEWGRISGFIGLGREAEKEAIRLFDEVGWTEEGCIHAFVSTCPGVAAAAPADPVAARAELRIMAADLMEMQPLLARTYEPEAHVVQVGDATFATWTWEVRHQAGSLRLADRASGLVEATHAGTPTTRVDLGLDGRPHTPLLPWVDLGPDMARWALGALRPIHAHLLGLWDALPRPTVVELVADDDVAAGEAIALACEVLAAEDRDVEPTVVSGARDIMSSRRVPAVRAITLFALLERHFQCEIKHGKGSEYTVYRPGSRIYTLPGHKRNTHYPSFLLRLMLRRLEIKEADFCAAVSRN